MPSTSGPTPRTDAVDRPGGRTPKPGNVDRERDHDDLRFEQFMAGAVGARDGLVAMTDPSVGVGEAFERAVAGMGERAERNTQFGALLVLAPLVRAAAREDCTLDGDGVERVVADTTVADAAGFYRAFEHVDVAVRDPPEGMEPLDVRRGADAVPALRERELTLSEVMERSADRDGVAREWVDGHERVFRAARAIADLDGPVPDRAAEVFLELLSREPDTFVADTHGTGTAHSVMVRAQEAREGGPELVRAFAESLVAEGVNPGTTADLVAGALFVAMERDGVTP
ncbi:triphosphoribosyl-dephospho-CoA synthase [Halobacteriales archaeon SW_7_71_33]|nr:MAG: triphosphoribosyl-dephospho-CoA synthase [Halobacteriales archaeon SW_7_71_33]